MHSFVGVGAVLVGMVNAISPTEDVVGSEIIHRIEIYVGIWIGCLTFTGSLVAAGKLQGSIGSNALQLTGRHVINAVLVLTAIGFAVDYVPRHGSEGLMDLYIMLVLSGLLGLHLVWAIGK
jgi:NAD(P) transhydrogenase subunit beta